LTLYVKHRYGA